jgi:hypothetical protein
MMPHMPPTPAHTKTRRRYLDAKREMQRREVERKARAVKLMMMARKISAAVGTASGTGSHNVSPDD